MNSYPKNKGNVVIKLLLWCLIIWGVVSSFSSDSHEGNSRSYSNTSNYYSDREEESYEEDGYRWAEENDPSSFEECQDQFGTSYEEDQCNEYVKENYSGYNSYNGYECTEDCSGHEAGYEWAEENGIEDADDCGGYSGSFIEGCESFVEENY